MAIVDGLTDFGRYSGQAGDEPVHRVGARRGARDKIRMLAYQLSVAEARERERIARDLHDNIGQLLTIASLKLGEIRLGERGAPKTLLDDLAALLTEAAQATRAITFDLSCPILRLGLNEALESVAHRISRSGAVQMVMVGRVPELVVEEPVLAVIFRVVRELAFNVQKHAAARTASIRPRCDGTVLRVSVVDDGVGFPVTEARGGFSRDGGFGLLSAHAQMEALGGWLELESVPGSGTRASAVLPLPT